MANQASTANFEIELDALSASLSNSAWNDEVKNSYFKFIEEEKRLFVNIKWSTDRINNIYDHVASSDLPKLKSRYYECLSKFNRLQ